MKKSKMMDDSTIRKIVREQLENLLDEQKLDMLSEESSGNGAEEVIEMIAGTTIDENGTDS